MISLKIIFAILFIHWVADFVCQTDWQAKNKSNNWSALLEHTALYTLIWFIPIAGYILFNTLNGLLILEFMLITFICHTITDYYTSRVNSQLYRDNKIHQFFVSIGFDQVLHYIQLFLTYYYLTR